MNSTEDCSRPTSQLERVFVGDISQRAQLIGEIRVLAFLEKPQTPEQILNELKRDQRHLPMIACDENGGIPTLEKIRDDMQRLENEGIVRRDEHMAYAFTDVGVAILTRWDKSQLKLE